MNLDSQLQVLQAQMDIASRNFNGYLPATKGQVTTIAIAMQSILPDRDARIAALQQLVRTGPAGTPVKSTKDLDIPTASVLIGWLYGLGPNDSLAPDMEVADEVAFLLESLAEKAGFEVSLDLD